MARSVGVSKAGVGTVGRRPATIRRFVKLR